MQWYRLRLIITVDVATLCNHWTYHWTGPDWTSVLTFVPKIALKKMMRSELK